MRIRKRGNNAQPGESSAARPGGGSHGERLGLGLGLVPGARGQERNRTAAEEAELGATATTTKSMTAARGAQLEFLGASGSGGAASRPSPSPTLVVDLELWQSSGAPPEPRMNLDEFVSSLVREKCFPADDLVCSRARGSMLGLMSNVQSDDPKFERLAGGSYAEPDTSLRLGQARHHHPADAASGKRKMGGAGASREFESGSDTISVAAIEACDESDSARRALSNAEPAELELQLESSPSDHQTMKSSTESLERRFSKTRRVSSATGSSKRRRLSSSPAAQTTTDELPVLAADHPANQPRSLIYSLYTVFHEAGRPGLTAAVAMATILQQRLPGFEESEECRSRRHVAKLLRSSPYFMEIGDQRFVLCSAMVEEHDEDEDDNPSLPDYEDATEESQYSSPEEDDRVSKRSRRSTTTTVTATATATATATLPVVDNEKRKQETAAELHHRTESGSIPAAVVVAAAGSSLPDPTLNPKPKGSGRSGRPKKLKYLKQDNVEELGNQCNRSDGKGWTCPLLAKTGYQLCDHHLDKLRCKPGSRSKYNKKKKKPN